MTHLLPDVSSSGTAMTANSSPLIAELVVLRRRMVRDLERFLRIQLSLPGTLMLRWPWARKATTMGVGVDSE